MRDGLRMFGDLRYPCYTLSPWQSNTVRICVSILSLYSEIKVGMHILNKTNTPTCHLSVP